MSRLEVTDPHFHILDLSTGNYPRLEERAEKTSDTPSPGSYLWGDYLQETDSEVEVVKAVHIEALPADPLLETRYMQAIADESPVPIALVARVDLSSPDAIDQLEAQLRFPSLRGIRHILNRHADPELRFVDRDYMREPAWRGAFAHLARNGLSFDLQIYPPQMGAAAELAATHPETTIVLNHAGMWADRNLDGWRTWRDGIRELARHENVQVKISGLARFDPDWTTNSWRPLVLETLDAFGPKRVMFASNFPIDRRYARFADIWTTFASIVSDLPESERRDLFSENAARIYRI